MFLLGDPAILLQPGFHILGVDFVERLKGHIHIGGVLHMEFLLPVLCGPLGGKTTLAFLLAFALPIPVAGHHIPGAGFFAFENTHSINSPFSLRRAVH